MKFRPLHDRVLVRRVEQEAKTTGGIIIPDTAQENPWKARSSRSGRALAARTARLGRQTPGARAICQGRRSRPPASLRPPLAEEANIAAWHYHTEISDSFVCLEGPMVVETRAPRHVYRLLPGERCAVPPKTAHYVHGEANGACRFLIVQGVGVYDFIAVGG